MRRLLAIKGFLLGVCTSALPASTACSVLSKAIIPNPEMWAGSDPHFGQRQEIEISSFKVSPESAAKNSKIAVSVSIKYSPRIKQPILLLLTIAESRVEERQVIPNSSGESVVEFTPIIRSGGTPVVKVDVLATGGDLSIVPSALTAKGGIQVYPNLAADLAFSNVKAAPGVASPGVEVVITGLLRYCCYPEAPIQLVLRNSTTLVQEKEFGGRDRSGEMDFEFKYLPVSTGSQILELIVDPRDTIEERFEFNNKASVSLEVR